METIAKASRGCIREREGNVPAEVGSPGATGAVGGGVSVLVPTYNEALGVRQFLCALVSVLDAAAWEWEVLIADDGSTDGTAECAAAFAHERSCPVHVVRRREKPRCLSRSVLLGARAACFPVVVVMDADLSHDPRDLPALATAVMNREVQVAVGSRFCQGSRAGKRACGRRLVTRYGRRVARILTAVQDPLSGFFACRRDLLLGGAGKHFRPRGFKILLELLVTVPGLVVKEYPISFSDRVIGQSKLRLRQTMEFFGQVVTLMLKRARTACKTPLLCHAGSGTRED